MRIPSPTRLHAQKGSALVTTMVIIFIMAIFVAAVHTYTIAVADQTANQGELLRANAAANAAAEVVIGRLAQWVTANNGYGPSINDCATTGLPGNAAFPAIASAIKFPAASKLGDFTVSTPTVYPVLPDDTYVTSPSAAAFLPDVSTRQNVSENSPSSVTRYYFTQSPTLNAPNVPSRSMTYQINVTVTPNLSSMIVRQSMTLTRYLRCDKVSPFGWCTYRMGSATYGGSASYNGPMYLANNVTFTGSTFYDSVLYGGTATRKNGTGGTFAGGGFGAQINQTALLSLVPNLVNNLAVDANGNRQASYETSSTPQSIGAPRPEDIFSNRELIEPPSNPANDLTPTVFKNARIYNQADARIQVQVMGVGAAKVVIKTVVNIDGTLVDPLTHPWVLPLLNAVNVNTTDFVDRTRSTSTPIESTDVNVGALGAVIAENPTSFPTGIVYVWDSTGLDGSTPRPLTGVRLWNAGVLPDGGLVVGSNDPVYIKGDFNTGATQPTGATVNTPPNVTPDSDNLSIIKRNTNPTTETQRTVDGYTIQPAGVFGDSITELSNSWNDANSLNTNKASSTTINLVEGWSTMAANELRSDDTYQDPRSRANPLWIEDWGSARRTMSGEEFVVWHSKYGANTSESGGNWSGDISFDTKAAAIKLNWGTVNFVRDRAIRTQ